MQKTTTRVLILGGGYAGQLAAARLSHRTRARITVVDASPTFTERIRLHQTAAGERIAPIPMRSLLPKRAEFVEGRVVGLHPASKRVAVETNRGVEELGYDWLILALGSRVDLDSVPGVRENAHALASRGASEAIAAAIRANPAARVTIIGAGLTGIESASELAESHPALRITLVSRGRLGDDLSEKGRAHVRRAFERLGIALLEEKEVAEVRPGRVLFRDGSEQPFDLCLWNGGFVAPELATAAGLPINEKGQVRVLPTLQVEEYPEIVVAGDAAEVIGIDGSPLRMACAVAGPMGVHAGEQVRRMIRGKAPEPFRFGYFIRCISLGRRDGLVQRVDAADRPLPMVVTGRLGAWIKELVCRFTVWTIHLERAMAGATWWPKPDGRGSMARRATMERAGGEVALGG